MAAKPKYTLPQEGTGNSVTGDPLPEPGSGSPSYSGGGTVLPQMDQTQEGRQQIPESRLIQQTFHRSMFYPRPRSNSMTSIPPLSRPTEEVHDKDIQESMDGLQNSPRHQSPPNVSITKPNWQKIPMPKANKRKRLSDSPPLQETTETQNTFAILPTDAAGDNVYASKLTKPPPVILYGIEDVNKLTESIETVVERKEYTLKIITRNQLRVNCTSVESYKRFMSLVREMGLIGHTFTRKEERCYRIVVKNLHHTTPHEAIIEAFEKTGNKVRGEIINARGGPNKTPTSTFFINLERSPNNAQTKNVKYIYNTAVTIEDPKKRNTIVQCMKCQQYGHSKNNCMRPYRCVKCAGQHKTSDCTKKDRNTPAKCALCLGEHPANYKGCEVYREILDRKKRSSSSYYNRRQPAELSDKDNNKNITNNKTPQIEKHIKPSQKIDNVENTQPSTQHNKKKQTPRQPTYSEVAGIRKASYQQDEYKTHHHRPEQKKEQTRTTWKLFESRTPQDENTENLTPTQVFQDLIMKQFERMDMLLSQMTLLMGLVASLVEKLT